MKKIIKIKININSPLIKINKLEVNEKKIIFFFVFSFIIKNNKFKNRRERNTCNVIEEICPQA